MHTKGIFTLILTVTLCSCYGQELKKFEARNGVDFTYEVILPEGYDKSKSYELAVVFSEKDRKEKGFEPTLKALISVKGLKNTILFVPKVPVGKPHWISHPIHHGLNDFMKNMRSTYGKRDQKFHFIGHLLGGRVAQTYSGMSSEYVASVSFTESTHWPITKQEYFNGILNMEFKVYVYSSKPSKDLSINVSKTTFKKVTDFGEAISMIDKKITNY